MIHHEPPPSDGQKRYYILTPSRQFITDLEEKGHEVWIFKTADGETAVAWL